MIRMIYNRNLPYSITFHIKKQKIEIFRWMHFL